MKIPNINRKRITELLKDGKRLDGRGAYDLRDVEIETGVSSKAEGSARVRIGKTEVIVGVKMGTQDPYTDHEDEGTMVTGMEFNPICGERYEPGPPKMDAIEVARVVDRGLRESGFIDWKKLCIKAGEKVWSISIDIYCINDDGSVMDASALAAMAALKVSRFPVYDEENDMIKYGEMTDTPLPLNDITPVSMTFYKVGDGLLLDPNRDEEDSADARVTLTISKPKKDRLINSMQKGGITSISVEEMNKIIEESEKAYDNISKLVEDKIKALVK